MATISPSLRHSAQGDDLLLRETNHRCSNDLQLVVGLLGLQSRRATSPEARAALADAAERVAVVASTRAAMHRERQPTLTAALQRVCAALHAHAEPRGVLVSLDAADEVHGLSESQITTIALVVNELTTNAIKHAFEDDVPGHIRVSIARDATRGVTIVVDDDGLPFPAAAGDGMGLGLVKRLMAAIGGLFIPPPPGSKLFELRVPFESR
jgi:two-component sensor histidine kinase